MSIEKVQRSDGTVWRVRWRDDQGRNRSRVIGRKRDAEAFDAELRRRRRAGELALIDAGRQNLQDFAREWWELYATPRLAAKTLHTYAWLLDRHVMPHLGAMRLQDITSERIARWRVDMSRDVGDPTVLKAMRLLSVMLERAVEWGRIPRNPCRPVRKPAQKTSRVIRPLPPQTVEQIRAFLAASGWPRDAALVSVLAYAGLRPGEALALTWEQVRDRTIVVDRATSMGVTGDTKTRRSRTVRLLAPLAQDLAEWRLASGRPDPDRLVFPSNQGGDWTSGRWTGWHNRRWQPARTHLALDARPYDLRHSFVSLLIQSGMNVMEIARQAGHSPTMTLDTYGHLLDEFDPGERVDPEAAIRAARDELVSVSYLTGGAS